VVSLNGPPVGKQEYAAVSADGALIKWSPGDGLVYTMVASSIAPALCEGLGCEERALMVSLGSPGRGFRSYPLVPGSVKAKRYMAEKFQFKGDELLAFTALVNFALCERGGPEWQMATELHSEMKLD